MMARCGICETSFDADFGGRVCDICNRTFCDFCEENSFEDDMNNWNTCSNCLTAKALKEIEGE